MSGGHTTYPKWVSFLSVRLVCGSLPLGCGVFRVFALVAMKFISFGPKEKEKERDLIGQGYKHLPGIH
jgi:hypothetical protein